MFFFFNDTATTEIYTLSLHDALPIFVDYCVVNDLPTLMWAVNLASLEMHPSLHVAPDLDRPTSLVFDLDPGEPAGLVEACQVGVWIRGMLEQLGLETFVKSSGSKGLQVYVPLNGEA